MCLACLVVLNARRFSMMMFALCSLKGSSALCSATIRKGKALFRAFVTLIIVSVAACHVPLVNDIPLQFSNFPQHLGINETSEDSQCEGELGES